MKDVLGSEMIACGSIPTDRRVDLTYGISHSQVHPCVLGTGEVCNDSSGAKTTDLIGGDIDQPEYTLHWSDNPAQSVASEVHRGRGVADHKEIYAIAKTPLGLNRGSTPRLS